MPKQINTPYVGQRLVRLFSLKGRFQPVLDEVIVPVVDVSGEGQTLRPAWGGSALAASGAGNQNRVIFANPANSGIIARFDSWWAVSGAPLTDFLRIAIVDSLSGGGATIWRDASLNGVPQLVVTGAPAVAAGALSLPHFHLDNDDTQWFNNLVVYPGFFIEWRQDAQNTTLTVSAQWTEEDEAF